MEKTDSPRQNKAQAAATFLNSITGEILSLGEQRSGYDDLGNLHGFPLVDTADALHDAAMRPKVFEKDFNFLLLLGNNRLSANGAEWEVRRSLSQPAFSRAGRSTNAGKVREIYKRHLGSRVDPENPESLADAVQAGALEIFADSLGVKIDQESFALLLKRFRTLSRYLQFFSWMPDQLENPNALIAAAKVLDQRVSELTEQNPSLRGLLAGFEAESGGRISGFQPRHEFLMILLAGVETTVSTLSWVTNELARRPDYQEVLAAGLQTTGGEARAVAFAHETMRLHPPLPFVTRKTAKATSLAGVPLPKDTTLIFSIAGLHRKERYWRDPQRFWPDRPEFLEQSFERKAFIPFFAGPRKCGGARLAMMEVEEATKEILSGFRLKAPDRDPVFDYALTLRPLAWDEMTLERR